MIRDLAGAGATTADADVLVIGAGTAGLVMAEALARRGHSVLCLESGGMTQDEEENPLNVVEQLGSFYGGAAHGRFRCLGGTSTRWGGALIPFAAGDFSDALWPVSREEILRYQPAVEQLFGLAPGPFDFPEVVGEGADHVARLAKWPAFARRNVANLLMERIKGSGGPQIWLNATVTDFAVEGGELRRVTARAADGATLTASARIVILAAGAIESTRILLLIDRQNGGLLTDGTDQLGGYFHDHLSVVVGRIARPDRKALNRLTGLRFEEGGMMRNMRFELADGSPLRAEVPPCFAHIMCEDVPGSGFDALRDLFRRLQQRRLPTPKMLWKLAIASPWLSRAVWWRYVDKRVLYADDADVQVHMVIEQEPVAGSRIGLSTDAVDSYGQPLATIDWTPSETDCANLTRAVDAFAVMWSSGPLAKLGSFERRPAGEAEAELAQGSGIYHPGGTTRMGRDDSSGVVDTDLRPFRLPNMRVVSTSVLPTGGGCNPTMMLMMLAHRCVDEVSATLARGPNTRIAAHKERPA